MTPTLAYIGGACDNPNVMDKEAGMLALQAFLGLHRATGDAEWLPHARAAADYVETWTYAWNLPPVAGDPAVVYPRIRTTLGQSVIATGQSGADNFMAIAPAQFEYLGQVAGD